VKIRTQKSQMQCCVKVHKQHTLLTKCHHSHDLLTWRIGDATNNNIAEWLCVIDYQHWSSGWHFRIEIVIQQPKLAHTQFSCCSLKKPATVVACCSISCCSIGISLNCMLSNSILLQFHFVTIPFCYNSILLQFHFVTIPFCYNSILLQFHFVTIPFCYNSILLQFHFVTIPFCYNSILSKLHFVQSAFRFKTQVQVDVVAFCEIDSEAL